MTDTNRYHVEHNGSTRYLPTLAHICLEIDAGALPHDVPIWDSLQSDYVDLEGNSTPFTSPFSGRVK